MPPGGRQQSGEHDAIDSHGGETFRLALGIERIGLLPLRAPVLALLIVVALSMAAGFGVLRLQVVVWVSLLFQSVSADFRL